MRRAPTTCGGWLLLCRPGFEAECAAEAMARWREGGGAVPISEERGEGWVRLEFAVPERFDPDLSFRDLVFARQGCWLPTEGAPRASAGAGDVAGWLPQWLERLPGVQALLVEAPDGDPGRRLWPLCSSLQERLAGMGYGGLVSGDSGGRPGGLRLHLTLLAPETLAVGVAGVGSSSPHAGGIPRLRHSRAAPSRSALKLEEALKFFLGQEEGRLLRPGMAAVDLGAAPGGWSWVLARRGLRVVAVDNGPLGRGALDTGLVDPVRADGFTYRPGKPVDWLVCDMVAPPARVAKLVGLWARQGLCRRAVFNLKLPSGDRLAEVRRCEGIVRREVANGGGSCELRFKQLYHDREEVTGYLQIEMPGGQLARAGDKAPPGPLGPRGRKVGAGAGRRGRARRRRG